MIPEQQHHQQQHDVNIHDRTIPLVLIRHGVAFHNILQHPPHPQQNTIETNDFLFDPPLTIDGKIQAVLIGETVRQFVQQQQQHNVSYQILTSPLTRCLQTAMYAFGIPHQDDETGTSTISTGDTSSSNKNTTHNTTTVPTIIHCHENLREACGIHHWDRRRTITELRHSWGRIIQFHNDCHHEPNSENGTIVTTTTLSSSDHDTLWRPFQRETIYELQCRISRFMTWLLFFSSSSSIQYRFDNDRNATNNHPPIIYVLVTHGVWMETMLQMYDATWSSHTTTGVEGHPRRIHNADIYSMECHYSYTAVPTTSITDPTSNHDIHNIHLQNVHQIPTTFGAR